MDLGVGLEAELLEVAAGVGMTRLADNQANLVFCVNGLGERAEVQANYGCL